MALKRRWWRECRTVSLPHFKPRAILGVRFVSIGIGFCRSCRCHLLKRCTDYLCWDLSENLNHDDCPSTMPLPRKLCIITILVDHWLPRNLLTGIDQVTASVCKVSMFTWVIWGHTIPMWLMDQVQTVWNDKAQFQSFIKLCWAILALEW